MRFLSPPECREFVAALALDPKAFADERKPRLPALKHARLFVIPDVSVAARPLADRLVAFLGAVAPFAASSISRTTTMSACRRAATSPVSRPT